MPSSSQPNRAKLIRRLQTLLVFIPVIITLFYVHAFSVELPYQDDWEFAFTLSHLETGNLEWKDFDLQHTENRVFIPQLICITVASLSTYRVKPIIYISYAFLCLSLLVLYGFFGRIRRATGISILYFLPVSLLFLTWRQYEGLLWASQLPNTTSEFFLLAALYCCTRSWELPIWFSVSVICAFISSFCVGSGLLAWPLCLGYLLFFSSEQRSRHFGLWVRRVAGWGVAATLCVVLYFSNYVPHPVPWNTGLPFLFAYRLGVLRYVLIYFGSPWASHTDQALHIGLVTLLVIPVVLFFAIKERKARELMFPGIGLVVLILVVLGPLINSRLALGPEQAYEARYVTLSSLVYIGLYFCLLILAAKARVWRYVLAASLCLFCLGTANAYRAGFMAGQRQLRMKSECAEMLRTYHMRTTSELGCMYPDGKFVRQEAPVLEKWRLSVFADAPDAGSAR